MDIPLPISTAMFPFEKKYRIDAESTIGAAIQSLDKKTDALVVMDGNEYKGVITASHLFFHSRYPRLTKAKSAAIQTRILTKDSDLRDAAEEMVAQRTYTLPVFDEKSQIVGLISSKKILQALSKFPEIVSDICQRLEFREPITAGIDSKVGDVYKLMRKLDVSRVVLTDAQGKVAGISSRTDLRDSFAKPTPRERFTRENGNPDMDYFFDEEQVRRLDAPIRNFMTQRVVTMSDTKDCTDVVPVLLHSHSNSIVLVDAENRPTRFVSNRDILQTFSVKEERSNISVRVTKPRKNMNVSDVRNLENVVSEYVQKLHDRSPVMEAEVTFNDIKSAQQKIVQVSSKVIVTLKSGDQFIGEGEDKNEVFSVCQALKRIDKQHRRLHH